MLKKNSNGKINGENMKRTFLTPSLAVILILGVSESAHAVLVG